MFACLYSLTTPVAALMALAETFTPRFEVRGPLVLLDLSGLTRLFGSMEEIGEHLRRAAPGPMRIAMAPTQTAAALLAVGRPGLSMVTAAEQAAALAALPVELVGRIDEIQGAAGAVREPAPRLFTRGAALSRPVQPPQVGPMWDALPMFESMLDRTSDLAVRAHRGGSWTHPRDAHAAAHTRTARRFAEDASTSHPAPPHQHSAPAPPHLRTSASASAREQSGELRRDLAVAASGRGGGPLLATLRRWGVKTLGALVALPAGEVYERLGPVGVRWQRLARGEDTCPLVPWIPEEPFEAALSLEWPIEGLEPLSFVLGRLLEPLSERLARADRGAAVLHTHLRLVSKTVHARTLALPAPMRDAKTLRTLVLLDLESNPPSAAVDEVRLIIEPTPARVLQWMLYERAQPSPEQTATLIARLTALMGEGHVGSPQLVDSWRPGQFAMAPFVVRSRADEQGHTAPPRLRRAGSPAGDTATVCARALAPHEARAVSSYPPRVTQDSPVETLSSALRRFRLPVPVRVQVNEGRPVRVISDRRGVVGGAVVQAAGPWRTSGEWWNDTGAGTVRLASPRSPQAAPHLSHPTYPLCWDRDEWDVALADGTVYRLYVARDVGQWFLDGVVD